MEEEKMGTMVVDGRIYNLDSMSVEELEMLEAKLSGEEGKIRKEIDQILRLDEEE